jgi:hypothetical protein
MDLCDNITMNNIKKKIYDYLGQTAFIHLVTVVCLTPWLLFLVGLSRDQYITWLWQASIMALGFNYFLYICLKWFVPRWHKVIKFELNY